MKKLKKLAIVMAFVLSFGLFAPAVSYVFADPIVEDYKMSVGNAITIEGFKSTGVVGTPYQVKTVAGTEVTVKNPYGIKVALDGENKFTPTKSGDYSVVYSIKSGDTVVFEKALTLTIAESKEGYSIEYPSNAEQVVPTEVGKPSANNDIDIVLPKVIVNNKDGAIENAWDSVTASVTVNGVETPLTKNQDGYFTYKITSESALGAYTFTYKYALATGEFVYYTKNLQVSANYKNDADYKLSWGATKPSSAQLGVETKLPTVGGVDDNGNNVGVYYSIAVTYSKDGSAPVTVTNDVLESKEGSTYFTANKVGSYTVTYTVKNFFNKEPKVASTSFEIKCEEDTQKPTPVVVEPYMAADVVDGELEFEKAEHKLATRSAVDNVMVYPIWAEDNANKYVEDNLTLYRTIKNSSGDTIFDESELDGNFAGKILVFNPTAELKAKMESADVADTEVVLNGYTKAQIKLIAVDDTKLNDGSTYTIYYNAKDKQNNEENISYTMRVSSTEDTEKPTIKFGDNLPDAAMLDELITFAKPTATDDVDTRMVVDVDYKLYKVDEELGEDEVEVDLGAEGNESLKDLLKFNEDTSKYEITITDSSIIRLEIIATVQDDAGNETIETKSVTIVSSGDTQATTIKEVESSSLVGENGAVQYEEVILPTISYTEDLPAYTKINFYIVHSATGTTYDAVLDENDGYKYELTSDGMKISGAKFTPTKSGQYDIYVTTEDAAGNITIQKFDLGVVGKMNEGDMKFENLPSAIAGGKLELGETASLTVPSFNLEDGYTSSYRVVKVSGPDGAIINNYKFTPSKVGTYEIQYVADITSPTSQVTTIKSKVYQVEVVDSTGPTVAEIYYKSQYKKGDGSTSDISIILPGINDISGINYKESSINISSSKTSKTYKLSDLQDETYIANNNITFDADGNIEYKFPNDNLVYTIKYSIKDNFNNETTKSYTINVGDTEKPVVTVDDKLFNDKYSLAEMKKNPLVIDIAKITATDNIELAEDWVEENIEVTVKNTTTGTIFKSTSAGTFTYNLTEAGTYTVTFTLKDAAGNEREVTKTFEVTEEGNAGMETEEIIGTVLIVVSVLVLAGVVIYFIVSKKKLDSKK